MIKLEQLQQFLVVSQCNGLMEAAERLHRTPSAVSMTLKQIETALGGTLFEGDRKRDLTPLGQFVQVRAEYSVNEHHRMLAEIRSYANGDTGLVRIVAVPSAATHQLPEAIATCQRGRAGLQVELRDTDSAAVHDAVLQGEADLGVASLPHGGTTLHHQLLCTDSFVCVCRHDHPLTSQTSALSWKTLQRHQFIYNGLCEQIAHPIVRELSDSAQLRVHNITSLLAFIRKGMGTTLLPEASVTDLRDLAILPLRDKSIQRRLYLLRRAEQTPSPAVDELAKEILSLYVS